MRDIQNNLQQKIELTELQAKILEVLGRGKNNALTGKDLRKRLPSYSGRRIRLTIEGLRQEHWPILSSARPPYGYYLPSNENYQVEVDECLAMMRNYIVELCRTRRNILVGAQERKQRVTQLPLFFK
jgi:hypothetical protein